MTKRNRGKQSNDDKYFATSWHPIFKEAVDDLCFLLSRGYASNSALQLVGNRYKLNKRQRTAISRICSSQQDIDLRQSKVCQNEDLKNQIVEIDGFNLLILLESALSGAYIFKGRDGTFRDISSVHGSYKRVQKTKDAILIVGKVLDDLEVKKTQWYFDKPVSNSGRLKVRLLELAEQHHFNWEVELVYDPDKVLAKSEHIVVSSDGWVLNHVEKWFNLPALIFQKHIIDSSLLIV